MPKNKNAQYTHTHTQINTPSPHLVTLTPDLIDLPPLTSELNKYKNIFVFQLNDIQMFSRENYFQLDLLTILNS